MGGEGVTRWRSRAVGWRTGESGTRGRSTSAAPLRLRSARRRVADCPSRAVRPGRRRRPGRPPSAARTGRTRAGRSRCGEGFSGSTYGDSDSASHGLPGRSRSRDSGWAGTCLPAPLPPGRAGAPESRSREADRVAAPQASLTPGGHVRSSGAARDAFSASAASTARGVRGAKPPGSKNGAGASRLALIPCALHSLSGAIPPA